MLSVTLPLKSMLGVKVMPSSAALMSDSVPLMTKPPLPLLPVINVMPVVCDNVSTPSATDKLTCIGASVPANVSLTLTALPFAELNVSTSSSLTVCGPGTVCTTSIPLSMVIVSDSL